ncbi:MAG TPA: hypothetical protein VFB72_15280, partial [Verrucomicrobiae bacterium]|nr:hypothetical protein [Verrucomicrobiae bacterium]
GGKVGPDLTSIGASAQPDYLVESVIYPNRKIKEGYHSVLVETKDGEELAGILVRENTEQLVLRDSTDKEITIPKNTVKSRTLGNSLMPSGLVDTLSTAQQLDLYSFLIALGKPGPFDASKGNVARFWKLYPKTLDVSQFGDEKILDTKLSDAKWTAAYSLVDGHLLKSEMEAVLNPVKWRDPDSIFAGTTLQVSGSVPVEFKLAGCSKETAVWLDGKPVKLSPAADGSCAGHVQPAPGKHTLVVKLPAAKLPDYLKADVSGGTFLVN